MTRRAAVAVLCALSLAGMLTGCSGSPGADPLAGTSWILTAINGEAPLPGREITLVFEENDIRGSSGCNTYFGTFEVSGDSLTISEVGSTAMACVEPELMEQEAAYLSRLAAVHSFSLDEGRLQLISGGVPSLDLAPQP